jgi:hypothetical protein
MYLSCECVLIFQRLAEVGQVVDPHQPERDGMKEILPDQLVPVSHGIPHIQVEERSDEQDEWRAVEIENSRQELGEATQCEVMVDVEQGHHEQSGGEQIVAVVPVLVVEQQNESDQPFDNSEQEQMCNVRMQHSLNYCMTVKCCRKGLHRSYSACFTTLR